MRPLKAKIQRREITDQRNGFGPDKLFLKSAGPCLQAFMIIVVQSLGSSKGASLTELLGCSL